MEKKDKNFCRWFYDKYKEDMKLVTLFLIANIGTFILFLMLTPFLPLFSKIPWTEYDGWILFALYILICLFSILGLISYFTIVGIYENYVKDTSGKKITFKVKPKWIVYTVAMIIIFTYVGYNGGYENGDSDGYVRGFGRGFGRGGYQSIDDLRECPSSMRSGIDPIFVHNDTVFADGSVHTEVSLTEYLLIENTDDERTASPPLILTLVNPVTLKEGLHEDLQADTKIIITMDGVQKVLYQDGNFTDGVLIGAIAVGDLADMTMTITLEIAVAGTFQDGQTYINHLFLYQSRAQYADAMPFMVTT